MEFDDLSTEMHGGTSGRKKEWSLSFYERRGGGLYTPRYSLAAYSAACTAACPAVLRPILQRHMFHPGVTLAWRFAWHLLGIDEWFSVDKYCLIIRQHRSPQSVPSLLPTQ